MAFVYHMFLSIPNRGWLAGEAGAVDSPMNREALEAREDCGGDRRKRVPASFSDAANQPALCHYVERLIDADRISGVQGSARPGSVSAFGSIRSPLHRC
jgi:hypothetical protein